MSTEQLPPLSPNLAARLARSKAEAEITIAEHNHDKVGRFIHGVLYQIHDWRVRHTTPRSQDVVVLPDIPQQRSPLEDVQ